MNLLLIWAAKGPAAVALIAGAFLLIGIGHPGWGFLLLVIASAARLKAWIEEGS